MNGGILGRVSHARSGLWQPDEVALDRNSIRRKMVTLDPIIDSTHWSWGGQAYGSWGFDSTVKPDIQGWLGSVWSSKTSTSTDGARLKSVSTYTLTGKTFGALAYIADEETLAKISYLNIVLYDGAYWRAFDFTTLPLRAGSWILVRSNIDSYTVQDAHFNPAHAVYVDLKAITGTANLVAANKIFWANLHYMG